MNKNCFALLFLGTVQLGCAQTADTGASVTRFHVPCKGFPADIQTAIDSGPWTHSGTLETERDLEGNIVAERLEESTPEFPTLSFPDKTLIDHLGCLLRVQIGDEQFGYFYFNSDDNHLFLSKINDVTSPDDLNRLMARSRTWGVASLVNGNLQISGTVGIYSDPRHLEGKRGTVTRTHVFSNKKTKPQL